MKKVLVIVTTGFEPYGGLASVALNYYRSMDKSGLVIDFASTNKIDKQLEDELVSNNSKYYCLGDRKRHLFSYLSKLRKLLLKRKYDVIHVHGNSSTMYLELNVAKKNGISERIAQCHTTRSNYPLANKLLRNKFERSYTTAIAVSQQAGDWLFGAGNYVILNNAIDVNHYKFDASVRKKIRAELGIDDKFVIGNVGKLNPPKNQKYLLEVFAEVKKHRENAYLLIAGGGELEDQLKEQIKELKIEKDVTLLGMVDDTAPYLQAMDVFVFTSIFEGLGMALIEAQASGLEVLSSDVVPKETKVSKFINYIGLDKEPGIWASKVAEMNSNNRTENSNQAIESITKHGYNISTEAVKLRTIYVGEQGAK